jgi:hypothetical protein
MLRRKGDQLVTNLKQPHFNKKGSILCQYPTPSRHDMGYTVVKLLAAPRGGPVPGTSQEASFQLSR